jgi:hypothetical protein
VQEARRKLPSEHDEATGKLKTKLTKKTKGKADLKEQNAKLEQTMREKLDAANKQLEELNRRMDDLRLVQSPPPPAAAPPNATASTLAARPTSSHLISPTVPLNGASSSAPAKTQPPKVAATNRPPTRDSCDYLVRRVQMRAPRQSLHAARQQ